MLDPIIDNVLIFLYTFSKVGGRVMSFLNETVKPKTITQYVS